MLPPCRSTRPGCPRIARNCLKQPESFIDDDSHCLEVRPDGFNTGPESFADCESLNCEELRLVLPLVAYWCSLNDVLLEIMCTSALDYECRFTERYGEAQNVYQIIEATGWADLCLELLAGAALSCRTEEKC
jgi:hypothetical protein